MVDRERKRLEKHTHLTSFGLGGWGLLFGLLFMLPGGLVLIMGMRGQIEGEFSSPTEKLVPQAIGLVFLLAGLGIFLASLSSVLRWYRKIRMEGAGVEYPWLTDYAWNQSGVRDGTIRRALNGLGMALFLGLFLFPFNYFAFAAREVPCLFMPIIGIFDLVWFALLYKAIKDLIHVVRFGSSKLVFHRFPFFLGEQLDAGFSNPAGLGTIERMTITLRCIEEAKIQKGDSQELVSYQVYAETKEIPTGTNILRNETIPISFALPQDVSETKLLGDQVFYWEIAVEAVRPGLDYTGEFLVPVYHRPERRPEESDD